MKFKFSHVLKIPTGPQAALTFGSIMHRCVRSYFELARTEDAAIRGDLAKLSSPPGRASGLRTAIRKKHTGERVSNNSANSSNNRTEGPSPTNIRLEEYFALDCGDIILEGRIDQINPLDTPESSGPHQQCRKRRRRGAGRLQDRAATVSEGRRQEPAIISVCPGGESRLEAGPGALDAAITCQMAKPFLQPEPCRTWMWSCSRSPKLRITSGSRLSRRRRAGLASGVNSCLSALSTKTKDRG